MMMSNDSGDSNVNGKFVQYSEAHKEGLSMFPRLSGGWSLVYLMSGVPMPFAWHRCRHSVKLRAAASTQSGLARDFRALLAATPVTPRQSLFGIGRI